MIPILIACLSVMFASLAGVVFLGKVAGPWTEKNLKYLISFSAGIFIVVVYHLAEEAIHESINLGVGIGSIIAGIVALHLLSKFWPEFHHHHERDYDHAHSVAGVRRILVSDAIHNIGDGILLASAFLIDINIGIVATASIFIHEVVQEISEFFVLKEAGLSTRSALVKNFATSSTILLGACIGYSLASSEVIVGPLLGFSAGAFLYVLINDLIPKSVKNIRQEKAFAKHLAWVALGLIIINVVNTVIVNTIGDEHSIEEVHIE
ncbi:MAG: ZIP family metal transporter [bacterium]|nr:ZIP family metal transporter [bacterium]